MALPASRPFSGKNGDAQLLGLAPAEVVGWKLSAKNNVQKVCSNKTNGQKRPIAGVNEASGTISLKVDKNGSLPAYPGANGTAKLYPGSSSGDYWDIEELVIGEMTNECDVDDGKLVSVEYNFEAWGVTGHGCLASATTTSSSGM